MARKLDPKAIEANRINRNPSKNERELRKQEVREAAEKSREKPRTYEVQPEPSVSAKDEPERKPIVDGYCRVSTQEELQASSFEGQIQHITQVIQSNPAWEFGRIFADEGISGTSVEKRPGFQEMIEAAKNHEVDIIVTKDMSRFGRNSREILNSIQLLTELKPPVGVIFLSPSISSLDPKNKLLLTILSALAELESQQKSESIKIGIRHRMQLGIFKFTVSNTLGYYRDHFGRLRIDPYEAEIVKFIYESFLEGMMPSEIAHLLTLQQITTPKGLFVWRTSTVLSILRNEKYNGNALMQKTVTESYLTHKSVKNTIIPLIMAENHHEPIIKMEDWNKVQELLRNIKQRKSRGLEGNKIRFKQPFSFTRIKSGSLKGFYLLDSGWTRAQREAFLNNIVSQNNKNDKENFHDEQI